MKRFYKLLFISLLIIVSSCSKKGSTTAPAPLPDKTNILSYSIKGKNFPVAIYNGLNTINITFPDSVHNASNLVADFTLSPGCTASINNNKQVSDVSKNSYNVPFTYTVSNISGNTKWTVYSFNNNYTADWGLGGFIEDSAANNCNYSWYIDQITTGFDSIDNCGPSCATMACRWADSGFTKTVHEARMKYVPQGGWWYTSNIDNYLSDNNITHSIINLGNTAEATEQILKRQVDLKQIVILCVDMSYIRQCQDGYYHVDRFFYSSLKDGHFFIVKGYKEVDGQILFETYDPNSWGDLYTDGTLKGKDRYYRYEDIFAASNSWWPYAIIIAKKGTPITENTIPGINKQIPVQHGM